MILESYKICREKVMALFSHSRLETYESCPLQYKYAYIDKVEVEKKDTVEAFLGSRVHEALEKLYRDRLFEKILSLGELLDYYHERWEKEWSEEVIIVRSDYTEENYRKMGERYLREYYQKHHPFDHGRVIGLETQFTLYLDEGKKYGYHVRIDRLMDAGEGVYEIHDYKTGLNLPAQELIDRDRQLAMYALWVKENFKDFRKARLVWHYLAFGKELESFRRAGELEELRQEVLGKIREIETTDNFLPTVSILCDWCLYRGLCPMWKHVSKVETLPENEFLRDPGVKLVDEYVRIKDELDAHRKEAEAKLEKIKEALIEYSKKEEEKVICGSEKKITIRAGENLRFPPKNSEERRILAEILQEHGRLEEVSDLDIYALDRAVRNREWDDELLQSLEKFIQREKSYRLSISKRK